MAKNISTRLQTLEKRSKAKSGIIILRERDGVYIGRDGQEFTEVEKDGLAIDFGTIIIVTRDRDSGGKKT